MARQPAHTSRKDRRERGKSTGFLPKKILLIKQKAPGVKSIRTVDGISNLGRRKLSNQRLRAPGEERRNVKPGDIIVENIKTGKTTTTRREQSATKNPFTPKRAGDVVRRTDTRTRKRTNKVAKRNAK
ncbi:MAG: hypothetical protein ABIH20_02325 [Candidatus Diapherotrites archaeon]